MFAPSARPPKFQRGHEQAPQYRVVVGVAVGRAPVERAVARAAQSWSRSETGGGRWCAAGPRKAEANRWNGRLYLGRGVGEHVGAEDRRGSSP